MLKSTGKIKKYRGKNYQRCRLYKEVVRERGLEPPRLAAPDPKSGASANFAIPAMSIQKG